MIFDCFPFFNELDLLDIRLNVLDPVVDHFVLVEATTTFQGSPKELFFRNYASRFRRFRDKIIHVITDLPVDDPWGAYRQQLNAIHQGLRGVCGPDDIVSVGDVDEIPHPDRLREFNSSQGLVRLHQKMYYYYLNCLTPYSWSPAYITPYKIIKDADMLDVRDRKVGGDRRLADGGWHFSYLGGVQQIIKKLQSFAHTEFSEFQDPAKIQKHLDELTDLLDRGAVFQLVPIDDSFPEYIRTREFHFRSLGLIK